MIEARWEPARRAADPTSRGAVEPAVAAAASPTQAAAPPVPAPAPAEGHVEPAETHGSPVERTRAVRPLSPSGDDTPEHPRHGARPEGLPLQAPQATAEALTPTIADAPQAPPEADAPPIHRVVVRAREAGAPGEQGTGRLRLEIDPPELGPCELEVTVRDGALRATVIAERPDTAAALREAEPMVRQALAERGLELAGYEVGGGREQGFGDVAGGRGEAPARAGLTPPDPEQRAAPGRGLLGRTHAGRVDLLA